MDPNPKKFPVLSYVLTRLNSIRSPNTSSSNRSFSDIEQPELSPSPKCIASDHVELMSRMPRLNQPELLASMAGAIADVAQTRSVLHALGERPDHESVDSARARIAEIDMELEREVEELVRTVCGDNLKEEEEEEEEEIRKKKEREKQVYRAVVQLDEMHEAYEVLLREAEERLVGIYGENTESGGGKEDRETGLEFNGEIVEILRDSREGRCVEKVDLSGKMLRILPEEFGRIAGLVVLNLSNNQLEVIPDSIAGLEQLEELRLSTNVLVSLPDSIGLLVSLKVLDISGNKLRRLPDSISCCRSLVELDVSYNELTYLPTNIGLELANLQKLMVHLNKIRFLPASVCEMKSLHLLDAHFNELHGLPHAFGKLTNLEFLDLSSNFSDLTELPETFGDLISLRELDLSNNQIHALPDTFGFLKNLVNLNLEQNPVEIPPTEVVNNGVKAVIEFMDNRSIEIIQQEELRRAADAEAASHTGWLTRSTSLLNSWVSGVSGSVSGYMGAGQRSQRDPFFDQLL